MNTKLVTATFLLLTLALMEPALSAGPQEVREVQLDKFTAAGILLDAPWKVRIYRLAHSKYLHPAWGWQHSERDYLVALQLAKGDGLHVDRDVLFAAAFLHDMSAFMPCKVPEPKLEHGECAAEQARRMLSGTGFPMEKLAAVQAAER